MCTRGHYVSGIRGVQCLTLVGTPEARDVFQSAVYPYL